MKIKINEEFNQVNNYSFQAKERKVKDIQLEIGDISLSITEHQFGLSLDKPQVHVFTKDGTYSMDFNTFIKNIIK